MRALHYFLLTQFLLIISLGCNRQMKDKVSGMIGQTIVLEEFLPSFLDGKVRIYSTQKEVQKTTYILFSYLDEKECQSCLVKMCGEIQAFCEKEFGDKIQCLFLVPYLEEGFGDIKRETSICKGLQVCIDQNDSFWKLNKFIPKEIQYRTLLLNNQMEILAVGNPYGNDSLLKLYKEIIDDDE